MKTFKTVMFFVALLFFISLIVIGAEKLTNDGTLHKQNSLSDEMRELGLAAVEIVDDYLKDRINAETAYARLETNLDKQDALIMKEKIKYDVDSIYDSPVKQDGEVWFNTFALVGKFRDKISGVGTDSSIREQRDKLEDAIRG